MKQKYNERRINKILKQKGKMSSDDALNELCRYFLGPDWYSMYPSHSDIACDIVETIEKQYKGCNVKSKKYTNATGLTIYKVNKDGSEEHYTYDKNGNLTKIERDSDNDIIYEYDEKGRLIKTIELNQT